MKENEKLQEQLKQARMKLCTRGIHEWGDDTETKCTITHHCLHCDVTMTVRKENGIHQWVDGQCQGTRCKICGLNQGGETFYDAHEFEDGCFGEGQKCLRCDYKSPDFAEHDFKEVSKKIKCQGCGQVR